MRRQPVDATPIWLMRQAGRYMPEYRALREKHTLLEIIRQPELACHVTLQPVLAFELDAAIIFSDILPPLAAMGLDLEFAHGEGPVIHNPVRTPEDISSLKVPPAEEALAATLEAIRLVRPELVSRHIPLIGFCGAPFTLAAYAVEGGGSRHFERVKGLMMSDPDAWDKLMGKLAAMVADYLIAQAKAGAQVVQLFDSWAGTLSPEDYRRRVLPYSRRVIDAVHGAGVPVIHFGVNTAGFLEDFRDAGGDMVGIDWHVDLDAAWRRLGDDVAVQGNLDPTALLAPWPALEDRARHVMERAGGRPGHVFNLGHGVLPTTPPDNVKRLVEFVHDTSRR